MVPDLSYELYVDPADRARLLAALRPLISPDGWPQLDQALGDPAMTSFSFSLLLPPEPATRQFAAWYPGCWDGAGPVRVGLLGAFLTTSQIDATNLFCLRIWPQTSSLQAICAQAAGFWRCLYGLLEAAGGRLGLVDDATGAPGRPFWIAEAGRVAGFPERLLDALHKERLGP